MLRVLVLSLCALAACTPATGAPDRDPPREPPRPARFDRVDVVRYHMRLHLEDLRYTERALVEGRLPDARAYAYLLSRPETDPGIAPWADHTRAITETATALAKVKTIDEGLRLEVRIAATCATCHLDAQKATVFPAMGRVPPDRADAAARMVRHQWAADRMWEGLIANDEQRWHAALYILASVPLPYAKGSPQDLLARSLQDRAAKALASSPTDLVAERARVYGELLVTCAACHRTLPAK